MKNNPKVSIIIPVYNGANFIKEAINSALSQTYKNIEVIVVNDGSNDKGKTRKVCKKYGNKITYIEKENGGVATALNLGIKNMKGDYFSWLSHDDRYYPNKIEAQVKLIKKYDKKTILYSNYDVMDINSNVFATLLFDHKELIEKPEYSLLLGCINGLTPLIHKDVFEKVSYFDETLRCTQDYELWLNFIKAGYKFVHMKEVLVTTRMHKNQVSNTSPLMLSEGNVCWKKIIELPSKKRKIELEGSEYNYYKRMYAFLITTPYDEAIEYTKDKMIKINKNALKDIEKIDDDYKQSLIKNETPSIPRIKRYLLVLKNKGIFYCIKRTFQKIFQRIFK